MTAFHSNIDGVYLGTVWCESEDTVQRSSSLQVRAFAIPFRCFMAGADIYIQGGQRDGDGEKERQSAV